MTWSELVNALEHEVHQIHEHRDETAEVEFDDPIIEHLQTLLCCSMEETEDDLPEV